MTFKHVLLGDTDSAYIRLDIYAERNRIAPSRETMVAIADSLQRLLQERLPDILSEKFVTNPKYLEILEPGREIVGRKALLKDKKKRYAIHIVDSEGFEVDKLKVMGMEVRRSDTPSFIQDFLQKCLVEVVQKDADYERMRGIVTDFRKTFRAMDPWRQGSPGRVKNLGTAMSDYQNWRKQIERGYHDIPAPKMHWTVKAALQTNLLMEHHQERRWDMIRDGDKVEVIYLRSNLDKIDAVAIKSGELYVPDWFRELPFDVERMEQKLIDQKLFNVIGDVLGWDFTPPVNHSETVLSADEDFYK